MGEKILVWGSGSQAKIYAHELFARGFECVFVDPYREDSPAWMREALFIGGSQRLGPSMAGCKKFIVAVGGDHGHVRHDIMEALVQKGLEPHTLIDSSANLKTSVKIGQMTTVLQNVTVNHETSIGSASILNSAASVDHECEIGHGVHIMGAAAIAGRVAIGDWAVIGTNATILPDIRIGKGAYVGAGAVVTKDVAQGSIVVGVPATKISVRVPSREDIALKWIDEH